ncbi:atrial natriuretic peptide receptor 3-like [Biomphalaria glabrata]|uniref:Atrial natriuretic peptide receptor 3-like n=1 Tax=Biomphalaria glabrata TaxID=6526 RepID=A0A9W2ZF57_BIOGL|nr:atrial natriuretic peptide receptor 3-like [Biomphalaria glabrata]
MKTMNAHYFLWTIFFAICAEVQNVKDTLSGSPDADLKSGNESPTSDPVLESALMTRIEGKSVYLYHRSYTRVVAGEEGPHGWWNDADENGNAAFNATLARPQRRGLPSSNETTVKPDIRIGVLLPFSRNMQHVVTKVAPILEYAVDKVALQMGPWAFNSLTLLYADSMCDIAEAMNKAIQLEERLKTVAFFGPVCDYAFAPVARQAKFWNTPLVTVGGTALDFIFLKTTTYPTTTRVGVISINGALGEYLIKPCICLVGGFN